MSNSESIQTFQAITENFDEGLAVEYLTRHNWDVIVLFPQGASNEYFANLPTQVAHDPAPQQPPPVAQPQRDTRSWGRYIWDGVYWVGSSTIGVVGSLLLSFSER